MVRYVQFHHFWLTIEYLFELFPHPVLSVPPASQVSVIGMWWYIYCRSIKIPALYPNTIFLGVQFGCIILSSYSINILCTSNCIGNDAISVFRLIKYQKISSIQHQPLCVPHSHNCLNIIHGVPCSEKFNWTAHPPNTYHSFLTHQTPITHGSPTKMTHQTTHHSWGHKTTRKCINSPTK